ncbi:MULTISPECIES: hypothetical protein [Oceanobacillus]|uniref:Type II secretion system protein GspF domain-containing protein n=1 Tax=Oceanobacillus kimchii TaxID=746691 RepID=A0ABQ5TS43_9BACI|nr:hypothetical protein [Oceanobacillus kimchii]GLO68275.1 hypothetical protein MACH08_40590 [Oceanobacillus kimchii]
MDLLSIAEVIVKIIGYTLILYGIWNLIGQYFIIKSVHYITQYVKRKRYLRRLNRVQIELEDDDTEESFLNQHIKILLMSINRKKKGEPINFYILSLFIFGVTFMLVYLALNDFIISLLFGVGFMCIPYITLRMRLANKRMKTSLAFMNSFHIIIQAYNSSSKNAYHMIQSVTDTLDDKELKNTFIQLLASMQQDRYEHEFREAVLIFSYTINSSFAIRFGNLLTRAYLASSDITSSLNDLNRDITSRKNDLENEKSLNVETKILGYLPILTLPIFLFAAWRLSSMYDFWSLFNNNLNIIIFLLALVFTGFSFFAVLVFSKPRSDV